MSHTSNNGDGNGNGALGANLVYSKFLFVTLRRDDVKARARIREAGACIGRGFLNEFHGDGTPSARSNETIQFLVASTPRQCNDGLLSADYVAHVTAKYRARLDEIQAELVRRLGNVASVRAIDGALQAPRYTSAALDEYAYKSAAEGSSQNASWSRWRAIWSRAALKRASSSSSVPPEPTGSGSGHARRLACPRNSGHTASAQSVMTVPTLAGSIVSTCFDRCPEMSTPISASTATACRLTVSGCDPAL